MAEKSSKCINDIVIIHEDSRPKVFLLVSLERYLVILAKPLIINHMTAVRIHAEMEVTLLQSVELNTTSDAEPTEKVKHNMALQTSRVTL